MDLSQLGRVLIIFGAILLVSGLLLILGGRIPGLGRLPGGVVWPLVRFNLGVETGQLGVAIVLLPLLAVARRSERYRDRVVKTGSVVIALCGAYWLVTRVFS